MANSAFMNSPRLSVTCSRSNAIAKKNEYGQQNQKIDRYFPEGPGAANISPGQQAQKKEPNNREYDELAEVSGPHFRRQVEFDDKTQKIPNDPATFLVNLHQIIDKEIAKYHEPRDVMLVLFGECQIGQEDDDPEEFDVLIKLWITAVDVDPEHADTFERDKAVDDVEDEEYEVGQ